MTSKTPNFDKALDEYFAKLQLDEKGGQWRTCRFSGEKFYVRPEDIEFYKKIRVSLPTLAPNERLRRRIAFSPGYSLFKLKSAATEKELITVYPPTTPFKIYEHQFWFSDKWDPLDYGIDYDDKKSFFEQFHKLQLAVPRPNLLTDTSNLNSDYTNNSTHLKNCYLTFDSLYGENLHYFECCMNNRDCVDCWSLDDADSCYMSSNCQKVWRCFFCEDTKNTLESYFLFDCRGCQNCFMCSNLRHKKYYFFNQPLTKEEYHKRLSEINLGNYETLQHYINEFRQLKQKAIYKENRNEKAVRSVGDWIKNSRDCYQVSFTLDSERVAYSIGFYGYRDSYDVAGGTNAELCYEFMSISTENNYGIKFSSFVNESRDLEYCDLCWNCHDCFGCIGIRNKSFCIFNKQYTEKEYWELVNKIKIKMLETGEYGEFFSPQLAPYPYNLSLATSYPGYDQVEVARKYGYIVENIPESIQGTSGLEIISAKNLPLDIKEIDDSFLKKVIFDEVNNKKFQVTKYELDFYRKYNFPLPRIHPLIRMRQWRKDLDLRLRFYDRNCAKCGKNINSSHSPEKIGTVYCESCYLQEII